MITHVMIEDELSAARAGGGTITLVVIEGEFSTARALCAGEAKGGSQWCSRGPGPGARRPTYFARTGSTRLGLFCGLR
jgi:hypothetical protein